MDKENEITIHGIMIVNSEPGTSKESELFLYTSFDECIKSSYQMYLNTWNDLTELEKLKYKSGDYMDAWGNPKLTFKEYTEELLDQGYVIIQLDDGHIEFDFAEKKLNLKKEMLKGQIKEEVMEDRTMIDGIYHSNEFENSWIVKKDGQFYSAPVTTIRAEDLCKVELDDEQLRPVGKNVEQLLLRNSNISVKSQEIIASQVQSKIR